MMFDSDRQLILSGSTVLEEYLLSKDLFWSAGGKTARGKMAMQLTLGNLLLSQARLAGAAENGFCFTDIAPAEVTIKQVKNRWTVNWGKKAHREWIYRLKQWSQYLSEMRGDSRIPASYAFHVRQRAILEILRTEADDLPAVAVQALLDLDKSLKLRVDLGDFVWEPEVLPGFPQESYWFLYAVKPQR